MKPDRHLGLGINDLGRDTKTGELVLVINCRCTLPHDNTVVYQASHADGCLMRPSEGLVMTMDGDRVTGWGCHEVSPRELEPVSPEKAADVKRQMDEILEKDRRKHKAKNFKGGRKSSVW